MPARTSPLATLIAAAAALVLAATLGLLSLTSAHAGATTVQGVGVLRLGPSWNQASGYDRYSTVIVSSWAASQAGSASSRALVYMSINVDSSYSTGVPYPEANANGWLLKDASGNPLTLSGYPAKTVADVGNLAYQQAWVNDVSAVLSANGDAGVYIDDVQADIAAITGGRYPSKYPSQQAWENAVTSFFAYVGPALKAKGYYVALNAVKYTPSNGSWNDGSTTAQFWQRIGPYVNGLQCEYWLQSPDMSHLRSDSDSAWNDHWNGWQALVGVAQSMGRDFIGLMYGSSSNTQAMRYGKASFLLDWDGGGSVFIYNTTDATDPWNPEWTMDIGTPAGSRYQVGSGWRRQYTGGTVLVNPNPSTSQTFQLGAAYTMPNGTSVTSVTLGPTSGLILRSTSATGSTPTAPVNVGLPVVSGTPQVGQLLGTSAGTWSGNPTSFAYQWERCGSGSCAAVVGATGSTYALATGDGGSLMRVKVTASNAGGSTTATSDVSSVITSAAAAATAPVNVAPPTIGGTPQIGQTLSVSNGSWSGTPTGYAYAWQRCSSGSCATIPGANISTYSPLAADAGSTLRARVTASNASGSATATSADSSVVTAVPVVSTVNSLANLSLPLISGATQVGQTISASTGAWSGNPTSFAYAWKRCGGDGHCGLIPGATGASYSPGPADVALRLVVIVTASRSVESQSATSPYSAPVAPAPAPTPVAAPVNVTRPALTGIAQVGNTVSATTGTWSGNPTSYTYAWMRCKDSVCSPIEGVASSSYVLQAADVGLVVAVTVTASNAGGSGRSSSWYSAVVAPAPTGGNGKQKNKNGSSSTSVTSSSTSAG